jgi:hypothetical protein
LFRCLQAHLPRSLRSLKILSNLPARAWAGRGDTAPVAGRGPLLPKSLSHWRTSSRCPAVLAHSSLAFVVVTVGAGLGRPSPNKKQKTLPPFARVEGNSVSGFYLPPRFHPDFPGTWGEPWEGERREHLAVSTTPDAPLARLASSAKSR